LPPYALEGPTIEALPDAIPEPETLGKVPPGGSGLGDPEHGVDEKPVVFGDPSVLAGPSWQHVFDTIPALVANFMTTHQGNSIRRSD